VLFADEGKAWDRGRSDGCVGVEELGDGVEVARVQRCLERSDNAYRSRRSERAGAVHEGAVPEVAAVRAV
jgi:hypothetical protein